MKHEDFTGTWRSRYWYPSNERDGQDVSEYLVQIHQKGNKLTMTSLPHDDGSYITIGMTLEGNLATGKWLECTAPGGAFEGMIYSGAMQLIVSNDLQRMDGKWVGVGREKLDSEAYEQRIYTGKWELVKADEAMIADHKK